MQKMIVLKERLKIAGIMQADLIKEVNFAMSMRKKKEKEMNDNSREIEKILRLLKLMSNEQLKRLYLTALYML